MQIYEIWREARETRSVQVNDVINGLLELGLATFAHLATQTRNALEEQIDMRFAQYCAAFGLELIARHLRPSRGRSRFAKVAWLTFIKRTKEVA